LTDEAERCARFKRVGHCFPPALLSGLRTVMHTEILRQLRILEEQRGANCVIYCLSRCVR
jgi:hypothetical protein